MTVSGPFQKCNTMHSDVSVVFLRRRAMEWRWVIYFEGGRETEGEKAGMSEGERSEARDYVVGRNFWTRHFCVRPGKQSANDF